MSTLDTIVKDYDKNREPARTNNSVWEIGPFFVD
jgi:hypothetical protein